MENFTSFEYFVLISLLSISVLYCISVSYLMYISALKKRINPDKLLIVITILYFILAFSLTCVFYFQETRKIKVDQNKFIPEMKLPKPVLENSQDKFIPKSAKNQNNVLFLKTYLKTYYKKVPDEVENAIAKAIHDLSHKHHVDFNLIVGMVGVESSFNPYAVSKIGARGLMQVRYCVWKNHLKIPNIMKLHNIYEGIEYGILAFLQCKKEAKGDLIMALQKYSGTKGLNYINKINKEINRFMLLKKNKINQLY